MPDENSKMDEMLKAYAKKRREQAGESLELHSATRQLLQGEVKRKFGKARTRGRERSGWLTWWPRIAVASVLAVTVALLLVPALSKSKSRAMRMAAAKATSEQEAQFRRSEAAAPATATVAPAAKPAQNLSYTYSPPPQAPLEDAIVVTNSAAISADEKAVRWDKNDVVAATVVMAPGSMAPNGSSVASGNAVDKVETDAAPKTFLFTQADTRKEPGDRDGNVAILQKFEFFQEGEHIRIKDTDGSIYEGLVLTKADMQLGTYGLATDKTERSLNDKAKVDSLQRNGNIPFQVMGTNVQLGKLVTLTGNISLDSTAKKEISTNGVVITATGTTTYGSVSTPQSNAPARRIEGIVNVGGTNEFKLNATQTTP